jgi:hypothetical protein
MIEYVPGSLAVKPIDNPSAWRGLERLLPSILSDFRIRDIDCLEFGVEHGFSTAALAQMFKNVTAVDSFVGDDNAGFGDPDETERNTRRNLESFKNINLIRSDYATWISTQGEWRYDLCHIDIVHNFIDTFSCGMWAIKRCDCVLFHDTVTYPEVGRAVTALANETGRTFYNWPKNHGLGILARGR